MRTTIVISCLVSSLFWVTSPVVAQTELNLGTSSTQTLPVRPLPTPPPVRQITATSDPADTVDQPLSVLGEAILDQVCSQGFNIQLALKLMPDLSLAHIRKVCPQALQS